MTVKNASSSWILFLAVLVAILAFAAGAMITRTGSQTTDPATRFRFSTPSLIREKEELDLQIYRAEAELRLNQIEIEKMRQQLAVDSQRMAEVQELALRERNARFMETLLTGVAITLFGIVLILVLAYTLIRVRSYSPPPDATQSEPRPGKPPWNSPAYRQQARLRARERELFARGLGAPRVLSTNGGNPSKTFVR